MNPVAARSDQKPCIPTRMRTSRLVTAKTASYVMASLSPPRFFFVIALGFALSLTLVLVLAIAAINAQSGLPL
ncbi:MAG: hypothetical protein AB7U62_01995 [Pseudolabrys sp.]